MFGLIWFSGFRLIDLNVKAYNRCYKSSLGIWSGEQKNSDRKSCTVLILKVDTPELQISLFPIKCHL